MFSSPLVHRLDNGLQRQAQCGQLIFDLWRDLSIHRPREETTFLHVTQLMRQHFLRNAGHGSLEVGEAVHSLKEIPQQHNFPASANEVSRDLSRAGKVLGDGMVFHLQYPLGA